MPLLEVLILIIIAVMLFWILYDARRVRIIGRRGVEQPSPGCERNQHFDPGNQQRWPWLATELDDIWNHN